ncbi:MAG TPA: cache domain-containing protein [Anaerolineae bacterium]
MKTQIKKPRAGRSLTATLTIAFLGLIVVALATSSGLQVYSNIQAQQAAIASRQQLIAQDATRTVSSFIQEKFSVLETMVRLAHPATASPKEQQLALEGVLGLQPAFRQLALLNAQDQESAQASRLSQTASGHLTDRLTGDALAQIRQGEKYIGPIYVDPVTSEPMVVMAVPATNVFGDVQGTLVAEVNLKFMWDLVDQLKVGETGHAYVVDRQGNLIAFRDTSRVLKGENVGHLNVVDEFIRNAAPTPATGVSTYSGIEGVTVVGTYVPLGTPDWAVVTELPWEEAYSEITQVAVASIGITLIMTVLAGLLGVYIARRLAVPLVKLTETATRITAGELELQAKVAGPSEVARLATAFNSMTTQLGDLIGTLEQRVAERTHALATSTEVSRRLSTILDLKQLVVEVVEQVQSAFDYYHAHIYLFDEARENLVMVGGTGEAGATMLARGHQIPQGKGLVGRAAQTNIAVLVPDTSTDPGWLPNPLLPHTKSEAAVPIAIGDQVLGVLDVQHNVVNGLKQEDADLLQSIANQVAIAVRNAQAYTQAQQQAYREKRINRINEKIQSAATIEDVLQITARELGQVLSARRASVQLSIAGSGNGRDH